MSELKENCTVIMAGAIGDQLLTLPALRALVQLFPQRLTLVCPPAFQRTFGTEFTNRVNFLPIMHWQAGEWAFDLATIAKSAYQCDWLVWLNLWHPRQPRLLFETLAPRHAIGFYPDFERQVPLDFNLHVADMLFELPRQLPVSLPKIEEFAYPPVFDKIACQQVQTIRQLYPAQSRILLVHSDTHFQKMWQTDHFVELLDLFLARHPEFIALVVGTQADRLDSGRYRERVHLHTQLALATALALVGQADLFVGIDSCMLHVADLFKLSGVGLFGPTAPSEWGFRFTTHWRICQAPQMVEIRVNQVLAALESLLPGEVKLAIAS